jgi:hydroxypyruvate isomerase
MPDFAANLSTLFTELPVAERFAAAARQGFAAVEFGRLPDLPLTDIALLLRRNRLVLVAIDAAAGDRLADRDGIACDPARIEAFRLGVTRTLAAAKHLDCRFVNCLAGRAPPGADPAELRRTLVENLRFAARLALAAGIIILVEPVDAASVPGAVLTSSAAALAVIDAAGMRNIALLYDVGHMQACGEDVRAAIARHLPRIGHIQIAGAPRRCEPCGGTLDCDALLRLIDAIGHRGWVGCEYHPAAGTAAGLGWLARHAALTPQVASFCGMPVGALRRPPTGLPAR